MKCISVDKAKHSMSSTLHGNPHAKVPLPAWASSESQMLQSIYARVPGATGTGHRPFYHGRNGGFGVAPGVANQQRAGMGSTVTMPSNPPTSPIKTTTPTHIPLPAAPPHGTATHGATATTAPHSSVYPPAMPTPKPSPHLPSPASMISVPQASGKDNPMLQAYEDGIETDRADDFVVPTMSGGSMYWEPRKHEVHNMQDWTWERKAFLKKLEDPRRRYLARYAWIRERMCSDRFRSPEYERAVPGTCIPKTNPFNYALGPPNMLSADALPDQEQILPGPGFITPLDPSKLGATSTHGGIAGNTPTKQAAFAAATCPAGTSWHPNVGACVEGTPIGTVM